jgi:hypothetical protein
MLCYLHPSVADLPFLVKIRRSILDVQLSIAAALLLSLLLIAVAVAAVILTLLLLITAAHIWLEGWG